MNKANKGYIVVEMSLIMPLVVALVFVIINMMVKQINRSVAIGEAYEVVYTKEAYFENSSDTATDTLDSSLTSTLESELTFVDSVDVEVSGDKSTTSYDLTLTASYTESNPGIELIVDSSSTTQSVAVAEEVRDTASNLRRWQLYGKILQ